MLALMRMFGPKAAIIGALGLSVSLGAATALAEEPREASDSLEAEVPNDDPLRGSEPTIDLEQLLRLPQSYAADGERRSGESRAKWRSRFFEAREKLDAQRAELARLQAELEGKAGDSSTWAAGAPGLSSPDPQNSTLSFKLRTDLRRARESIEQAENDLRALRVEADLADVPDSWRE